MNEGYIAVFEPDEGRWIASVPDLPGCFSEGTTLEEAKLAVTEAIQLWIDAASARNWPIPKPRSEAQRIAV